MGFTYKKAGVDINAGNELVKRIKRFAPEIGGFSGLFPLPNGFKKPMLVGCTDGVGTKLKIATIAGRHDTIGIDLVAMNVNDLVCCGAKPLFFLDYFACGELNVGQAEKVIQGIVRGCREAGCVLLGGETAEMPGFYKKGEYDLAGFAVGLVDKANVIDGSNMRAGDIVIGLPSSGLHSNGYSLVRRVFSEQELKKQSKILLTPTKIYVKTVLSLLSRYRDPGVIIKGIAHITGGGFIDNIPRVIPKGLSPVIKLESWPVPEIFRDIARKGNVSGMEMLRTFNMGIGLIMVISPSYKEQIRRYVKGYEIGWIEKGRKVRFV